MGSRQLNAIGISLVLLMLLVPMVGQSFANDPKKKIEYNPKFPPVGSTYAVNLSGSAHILTTQMVKPVSAHLELKVTNAKTWGVPSISLALVKGDLKVGDETYTLTRGTALIVPVNRLNIKEYSDDNVKVLTAYASLVKQLPISIAEGPVDLLSALNEKSAIVQIRNQYWVLDNFSGNISRVA